MTDELVEVYVCSGQLDADVVRIFLESRGFRVMVSQESAGIVHGLTVGELGLAHLYVPAQNAAAAREALAAMEEGKYASAGEEVDLATGRRRWKKKVEKRRADDVS